MTVLHPYRIYGLNLLSSRALSRLPAAKRQGFHPDITVTWKGPAEADPEETDGWHEVITPDLQARRRVRLWQQARGDGRHLWLQFHTRIGRLDFLIGSQAATVAIHWPEDVSFADMQSYFVGPVFACLLRWRGVLCLHASVVAQDGRALILIGNKGIGKSTTAAALVRAGWHLVADDVAALTAAPDSILVQPGYPSLRLAPAASAGLFGRNRGLKRVYGHVDKHYLDLGRDPSIGGFSDRAVPVAGVFFLGSRTAGSAPRLERLAAGDSLIALVRNTIGGYVVFDAEAQACDFAQMAHLARSVPQFRLTCPRDVAALPALADLLPRGLAAGRDGSCRAKVFSRL